MSAGWRCSCSAAASLLLAATFVIGVEIKGARRWISVPGLSSVQPSEFVKPSLAVISAWLLAQSRAERRAPGYILSTLLVGGVLALLVMQPDLGMSIVVALVWAAQLFVVGLPMWVAGFGVVGGAAAWSAPTSCSATCAAASTASSIPRRATTTRSTPSLEAFMNGSLFGRGPGEGTVKAQLPDAHTDFVMAVAGEEFGLVVCLMILALFAFVTLRALSRASKETSLFITLAATGLGVQFGLQAPINMASTIQLIPAKGMTLPFISYGGSSALAMAICVGMMLSLTREHAGLQGGGVMAEPRPSRGRWSWRPAAPAGTCSPPKRWPASSRRAACRSPWSPIRAAGSGRARWRAGRSTTSIRQAPPARCGRRLMAMMSLGLGLFDAWRALGRIGPSAVVGFGGYASVPTMIAARLRRLPSMLHEQNAVLGKANRLVLGGAARIATSFARTRHIADGDRRARLVGNPVRETVRALRGSPYRAPGAGRVIDLAGLRRQPGRGVVQPGRARGDRCPCRRRCARACAWCSSAGRRISSRCASATLRAGIVAELAPFFADLPQRLAAAHLVIGRAGASTVAELAAIGRPSILVPYPYAADDHQTANARAFEAAGACIVIPHAEFTAATLAGHLAALVEDAAASGRHGRRRPRRRPARRRGAPGRSGRRTDRRPVTFSVRSCRMRALPLDIGLIHFVGIGGIGMSGIAEVLHNLGYKVQGSDIADGANTRRLRRARHQGRDRPSRRQYRQRPGRGRVDAR